MSSAVQTTLKSCSLSSAAGRVEWLEKQCNDAKIKTKGYKMGSEEKTKFKHSTEPNDGQYLN
jgi:hypothetical protein